jgi:hypothetical protein
MTTAGKIALLLNIALSIGFAAWGLALYANRVDLTNQKSGETAGEYALRDEAIKNLRDNVVPKAMARWSTAVPAVDQLEARRPKLQAWYDEQLKNLREGTKPVQALVFNKGVLQVDAEGVPGLQPLKGLASIAALEQTYAQFQEQVAQTTKEITKLVDEERKLTEQIGDGKEKGLRADLAAVQRKEKISQDEEEFLKPLLYNRQAEYSLLMKRQQALEARIKELQGLSLADQP